MNRRTAIEVLVATVSVLFFSAVGLSFKYQHIFDSCLSPDSSVGLFGRIVIALSPIPSLLVIGKSKTNILMKVLLGVLVLAIVAFFWFWLLRNPGSCS